MPSIAEQTAALMQDPRYLVQQMRRREEEERRAGQVDLETAEDDDLPPEFWEDDEEPDILTGHEVLTMDEIDLLPVDSGGRMPEQGQEPANAPPQESPEGTAAAAAQPPQHDPPAGRGPDPV